MNIEFLYNPNKDTENFIKSSQSINNRKPTSLMRAFLAEPLHELDQQVVGRFLESFHRVNEIDVTRITRAVGEEWRNLEASFIKRSDTLFGIRSDFWPLVGYLSTNSRCTYQIKKSEFFVYMLADNWAANIMHELFHFYTWYAFHWRLDKYGVDEGAYNDFKEALTVLLNVEFKDIMSDATDFGYPQHAKLRENIRVLWLEGHSLASIAEDLLSNSGLPYPSSWTVH